VPNTLHPGTRQLVELARSGRTGNVSLPEDGGDLAEVLRALDLNEPSYVLARELFSQAMDKGELTAKELDDLLEGGVRGEAPSGAEVEISADQMTTALGVFLPVLEAMIPLQGEAPALLADDSAIEWMRRLQPADVEPPRGDDTQRPDVPPSADEPPKMPQPSWTSVAPSDLERFLTPRVRAIANDATRIDRLKRLLDAPGFQTFAEHEKEKLAVMATTTEPFMAQAYGNAIDNALAEFGGDGQARELRKLLQGPPPNLNGLRMQEGWLDANLRPYDVQPPVFQPAFGFESGSMDATRYGVTIDGQNISVLVPTRPDPSFTHHTLEEVALALAKLPRDGRSLIREVRVDPRPNPADAMWAKQYGTEGFASYMTADATGTINLFPMRVKVSQGAMESSLLHEIGHTLSRKSLGGDGTDAWRTWANAIAADGVAPSEYAMKAPAEDFAELYKLYLIARGRSFEQDLPLLYPNRMPLLLQAIAQVTPS
jgi:hypothetical protein